MDDIEDVAGPSNRLPASIDISRPTKPDHFHPVAVGRPIPGQAEDIPRIQHDYTENASQADVDAVARERKATEGMGDFIIGSLSAPDGDCKYTKGIMPPSKLTCMGQQ